MKAIQIGRTILSINDSTLSKQFDREIEVGLPMFGQKINEASEDVDAPNQDHIQTPVPLFQIHPNNPVVRGIPLPHDQYRGNPPPNRINYFNRRESSENNNEVEEINYLTPLIIEPETPHRGNSFGR